MSFSAKSKYKWIYVAPGKEQKFDDYARGQIADDNMLDIPGKEKLEDYTGPTYKIRIGKLTFYAIKGLNSVFVVPDREADDGISAEREEAGRFNEAEWIGNIVGKKKDMIHFFGESELNELQYGVLYGKDYETVFAPIEYMGKNVRTNQFPPKPSTGKRITVPKALAPTLTSAIALNVAQMKQPELTNAGVFGQPNVPDIQQLIRDVNKHDLIHGGDKPVTVIGQGRTSLIMGDDKPMMMKDLRKAAMRRKLIEDS